MINLTYQSCHTLPSFENATQFNQAVITCAKSGTNFHIVGKVMDSNDRRYKQINTSPEGWRIERRPNGIT